MDVEGYADEILSSGFPGIRGRSGRATRELLSGYIDNIINKEFEDLGIVVRRPSAMLGWLKAYAAATATTTSYNKVLRPPLRERTRSPAKTPLRLIGARWTSSISRTGSTHGCPRPTSSPRLDNIA
ncbi:MAG: hypothetical protein LBH64_01310 [Coriobacteriales bacterium]|nr:hypothetical protein [Coriobacteriales bacterium]